MAKITLGMTTVIALVAMDGVIRKFNNRGWGPLRQLQETIKLLRACLFNLQKCWAAAIWEWKNQWEVSKWKASL